MKLCIVQWHRAAFSETFIRAQVEKLPAETTVLYGKRPWADPVRLSDRLAYLRHRARRVICGQSRRHEYTQHCLRLFRRLQPDAVIAQYGPIGVQVMDACLADGVPWIVHFRGYDASMHCVLERHRQEYARLLRECDALIAVSREIQRTLIHLGAPAEKVHYNPSGADCTRFTRGDPAGAAPVFLSVGRFVDKKAPHRTIEAFARVHQRRPGSRLRMIGDGPLLRPCQDLARQLGIGDAVCFLGAQPHEVVAAEMTAARAFVQHSVAAPSGDSEGTPVAVMEAGASGLPTIATLHAGIRDVVVDGETGYLVEEHDTDEMARAMLRLVDAPHLAARLGHSARQRVETFFSQAASLRRLWTIIEQVVQRRALPDSRKAA